MSLGARKPKSLNRIAKSDEVTYMYAYGRRTVVLIVIA